MFVIPLGDITSFDLCQMPKALQKILTGFCLVHHSDQPENTILKLTKVDHD